MYGDIKQKYIDELERGDAYLASATFKNTEDFEKKVGKDLCEMTEGELIECLRLFNRTSNSLNARLTAIMRYLDWCVANAYSKFNIITSERIPRKILIERVGISGLDYINPNKLEFYCEKIAEDANGILYETFFRCIYEGLEDKNYENLNELRVSDIDRENHTVRIKSGKIINITQKLEDKLINCATLKEIVGTMVKKRPAVFVEFPYPDSIFKTTTWEPKNPVRHFSRYMADIRLIVGDIRADSIRESGWFNRVAIKSKELGYDLSADLMSDAVVNQKGLNKAMTYQNIFLQLGIDITWNQFRKRFGMWSEYVDEAN